MIPEYQSLVLSTPLYTKIDLGKELQPYLMKLRLTEFTIDGYCPFCRNDATFTHRIKEEVASITAMAQFPYRIGYQGSKEPGLSNFLFSESFTCARDANHFIEAFFKVNRFSIEKIGQTPSIADLQFGRFKKYEGVLEKKYHSELTKAIGLKSHGIGIGSFVYLRRIFEKLIEDAHAIAKIESGWNEEEYQKARMSEKVALLQMHLPTVLVENKSIYGILSSGIHELDENDTLEYHDTILTSIELILDEQQHEKLKLKRQADLRKKMTSINMGPKEKIAGAAGA